MQPMSSSFSAKASRSSHIFRTTCCCSGVSPPRSTFGGGCTPLALARGGARGVLFFMIKQKIIRDKMRYSNLSNNMMISEL